MMIVESVVQGPGPLRIESKDTIQDRNRPWNMSEINVGLFSNYIYLINSCKINVGYLKFYFVTPQTDQFLT